MTTTYELMAILRSPERDIDGCFQEWHESTTVEATSMEKAKKMAWTFAQIERKLQGAVLVDCYAINDETGEQSQ